MLYDPQRRSAYDSSRLSEASDRNAAAERKLCVVCDSAPRNVLFTACGHFVLCDGCAAGLLARGAPCPTCRTPVLAVGVTSPAGVPS